MSFELPLQIIILRIIGILLVGMVHGLVLAGLVTTMGDRGLRHDGRLTANPLAHAAPLGVVSAVFSMAGWIRQLDLEPGELRQGRGGLVAAVLISLAVPVVVFMLLLQLRGLVITTLPPSYSNSINLALRVFAQMSLVFAVVNLIPLPPFAGGYLLQAAAPRLYEAVKPRATIIAILLVVLALIDRGTVFRLVEPALRRLIGG